MVDVVHQDLYHITLVEPKQLTEAEYQAWCEKLPGILYPGADSFTTEEEKQKALEAKWTFRVRPNLTCVYTESKGQPDGTSTTPTLRTLRFLLDDHNTFRSLRAQLYEHLFRKPTVETNRLSAHGHMTVVQFDEAKTKLSVPQSETLASYLNSLPEISLQQVTSLR